MCVTLLQISPEQQSPLQCSLTTVQHLPFSHIWSCATQQMAGEPQQTAGIAHVPQLPPQPSSPHPLLAAQLGVHTHWPFWQCWPEGQPSQVPWLVSHVSH